MYQNLIYCQASTSGTKNESAVTDNDHFNKSENKVLCYDGLETTNCCDSNHVDLRILVIIDTNGTAGKIDGYVGFEVFDESLCGLQSTGNKVEVEIINQNYYFCND